MVRKTRRKLREMEEIVEKYESLIERIEDSENMLLVNCEYTPNGVEFDFIR